MDYEELDDLKYIKKHYGEKMSHLCRRLFPSILEHPGLLYHLLTSHFYKSKSLYYDIVNEQKEDLFKEYIYSFLNEKKEEVPTDKTVKELLDSVGYDIYECKTNEDISKFQKYYAKDEELCTFKDQYRLSGHRIFFIIKRNVNEIKRENFSKPLREDEYSTSVLDLQFDKGPHQRVSIKSRYNHRVLNPDATYSNNLERIVPGLTSAFERDYGFNIGDRYKTNFELNKYVLAQDGRFYKYNYEIHNKHYCPDNIIIDNGRVIDKYIDKGRYTIFDYFILDEHRKKLFLYDKFIPDGFAFNLKRIKNIEILNKKEGREITITLLNNNKAVIELDKDNKLIGYINNNMKYTFKFFLVFCCYLRKLELPNLVRCGDFFLSTNDSLEELSLPKLISCGNHFLRNSYSLIKIDLPSLTKCKDMFLCYNNSITNLYLPNLMRCGNGFIPYNHVLEEANLPLLLYHGNMFLEDYYYRMIEKENEDGVRRDR